MIPIILRPVDWQKTPLSGLQALPTNGKPVVNWKVRDNAFLDIAQGIEKTIKDVALPRESTLQTQEFSGALPPTSSIPASFTLQQEDTLSAPSHTLRDTSEKTSCVNQKVEEQRIIVKLAEDENDGSRSARAFLCMVDDAIPKVV